MLFSIFQASVRSGTYLGQVRLVAGTWPLVTWPSVCEDI